MKKLQAIFITMSERIPTMPNKTIRTRFAPSPTGFMHLGNLRTALYAWLYARANKGKFILRIEDTDQSRLVEGAVDVIYATMRQCGLDWDEGPDIGGDYAPYIQSERKDSYMQYALQLVESGHAYYCYCEAGSEEDCACRNRQDGISKVIRQKTPTEGSTTFRDEIYGDITVQNSEIEDQILIKSDGMPTYNFANVIDDHSMNITHIIRGNEYLSSTPKYNLLYDAFGWDIPTYIHVPPIMRNATQKLSKRDGDAYFEDFKDRGYLTPAIINYIALLGWSPRGDIAEQEIFSLDELVAAFDADGISKSPAIFDIEKMRAINAEHIRRLSLDMFKTHALPYVMYYLNDNDIWVDYDTLCKALQPRCEVLTDIKSQIDFIPAPLPYEPALYANKKMKTSVETAKDALTAALDIVSSCDFNKDTLYAAFKELADRTERKPGFYLYPLQVALTGKPSVPGGGLDICIVLGREVSVARINAAIAAL